MTYIFPDSAVVTFTDGRKVTLTGWQAGSLYLDRHPRKVRWDRKRLGVLGGRSEWERALQKRIIDWLAKYEDPRLKRVLIIGDSIRMRESNGTGYGLHAYRRLVGRVNVTHIPHRTGSTRSVLENLHNWLSCNPDIVHFNAGLHDLAFNPSGEDPPLTCVPLNVYGRNVEQIVDVLRRSSAEKLIWASSTPVHDEWHMTGDHSEDMRNVSRRLEDVRRYNDTAAEIMHRRSVEINDLFTPIMNEGVEECLRADGVHLSAKGAALLGRLVAERILARL